MTLLALGPLTNVVLALSIEPRMASTLAELIAMGGAVLTHGNVTEVATANLYINPEAAAMVYQSGAPVVQVGMDVCQQVAIPETHLERIHATPTPTMQLLARITPHLMQSYVTRGLRSIGVSLDQDGLVSSLEQMACPLPFDIDIRRVWTIDVSHDLRKVAR